MKLENTLKGSFTFSHYLRALILAPGISKESCAQTFWLRRSLRAGNNGNNNNIDNNIADTLQFTQ